MFWFRKNHTGTISCVRWSMNSLLPIWFLYAFCDLPIVFLKFCILAASYSRLCCWVFGERVRIAGFDSTSVCPPSDSFLPETRFLCFFICGPPWVAGFLPVSKDFWFPQDVSQGLFWVNTFGQNEPAWKAIMNGLVMGFFLWTRTCCQAHQEGFKSDGVWSLVVSPFFSQQLFWCTRIQ